MTRLTETDVTTLTRELEAVEARLLEATGLGLRDLALHTVTDGALGVQLHGARIAAVPMETGEGVIPGSAPVSSRHCLRISAATRG